MTHEYVTNCQVLYFTEDYLLIISMGYGLMICLWVVCVWFIYDDHSLTLQKALLIIPVFKLVRVLLYGMYIGQCPWAD